MTTQEVLRWTRSNILLTTIALFLVLAFSMIAYKALFEEYTFAAVTHSGDGLGTVAGFGMLKDMKGFNAVEEGLLDDLMVIPSVYQDKWTYVYKALSYFFEPDNVYDIVVLIFWLLNLAGSIYLFTVLGLKKLPNLLFAMMIAGMEVFASRITGHITLAFLLPVLLQVTFAIKVYQAPRLSHLVGLALTTLFCFGANEYYGYFGTIFVAVVVLAVFALEPKRLKEVRWSHVALAMLIFVGGMVILYFNIFEAMFFDTGKRSLIAHSAWEIAFYSIKNPFGIFDSVLYGLHIDWKNPAEFTFHTGALIGIWLVATTVLLVFKRQLKEWRFLVALGLASLVLASFGMTPESRFSLGKITAAIAPQFRVGARAYLWVGLGFVISAALLYRHVIDHFVSKTQRPRLIENLFVLTLLILSVDVTQGFYLRTPTLFGLPDKSIYSALGKFPQGKLLEIPFYGPNDTPEVSYVYNYNRYYHKKELINTASYQMMNYNPRLGAALVTFKDRVENPTAQIVSELAAAGISYLVCSEARVQIILKDLGLKPILDDGVTKIYRLAATSQGDLRRYVLALPILDLNFRTYKAPWSQVGRSSELGLSTERKEGFLLFGPYLPLAKGEYSVRFSAKVATPGAARFDVVAGQGTKRLLAVDLDGLQPNSEGIVTFSGKIRLIEDVGDLEIRMWVDKKTVLTLLDYLVTADDS